MLKMNESRSASLLAFLRARVSRQGYLGLHLTVGALALMLAAVLFGNIAEDVVTLDAITLLDAQVSQWFHVHARPPLTTLMLGVTYLHSALGIIALSGVLAIYWVRIKAWNWLLVLFLTVPLGMLLNVLLKNIFQRARPSFEQPLLTLTTYSFPSGHTAAATLFYGVLAAYLCCRLASWRWRVVVVALAALLVALVGLSRIYLGVHYLSDVVAAIAASSGWLAVSLTAVGTLRRRRQWQLSNNG